MLVLIHGLGDSPYIFEDIALSLKKNFRIIAYPRRGHCPSAANDLPFDNFILVEDLKFLLGSLNIEIANLLGWSIPKAKTIGMHCTLFLREVLMLIL